MPSELHQAIVAGKLKEAWQHFAVHPILTRQEEGDDEMLQLDAQGTVISAITSASASKKASNALAVKVQEEQLASLSED